MNARIEFLKEIEGEKLVCARVGVDRKDYGNSIKWNILKNNYSMDDFNKFCQSIDYSYHDGFGSQELFGVILFEDSFSDRHEYDGSESWVNHKMPTVDDVINCK